MDAAAAVLVAALAGRPAVTEPVLADHLASESCYGAAHASSRRASFMRLLEAEIAEEALARRGVRRVDDAALADEAARIARETRAPEILACVRKRLRDDARYRRAFVRPRLIEARLREHIFRSGETPEAFFTLSPKIPLRVADPDLRAWLGSLKGNPRLSALETAP